MLTKLITVNNHSFGLSQVTELATVLSLSRYRDQLKLWSVDDECICSASARVCVSSFKYGKWKV